MDAPQPRADATPGAWAPLGVPAFRSLWLAIVIGNIGTWVNDVAAAWLMTELTDAPLMIAAVQSATSLPMVVLALVAGTLADLVDRRRLLIVMQLWMMAVATALAVLAWLGQLHAWSLLALTFAIGAGAALAMPAQSAVTQELVPRPLVAPAIALSSVGMNIARSIGPALGGTIVAVAGVAAAFAINAISFLGTVFVLLRWKRTPAAAAGHAPPENFIGAFRAGLRFAWHAPAFRSVIVRAACFFVFASALTALLPLVVRRTLQGGAGTFGLLLGCIGVGALFGAALLPRVRARWGADRLIVGGAVGYAVCIALVAQVTAVWPACIVMLAAGMTWIAVLSSFQAAAQLSVPAWVRARALSLYIMTFAGGMALGSLAWGSVAQFASVPMALRIAALGTIVASLWAGRYRIGDVAHLDLAPSGHWPQPIMAAVLEGDRGPVLVTVEYAVAPGENARFHALMAALGESRRRDGALQWSVLEDVAQPGTWLESFIVGSWSEHLRQHQRVTGEERRLQAGIAEALVPGAAPVVRHFLAPDARARHARSAGA
ncbi:MFS transporter [Lysobacter sp. A6]|uniref:MFS transporter n=1 Tax=Noviluteimonas lactosilytica TaxID=2888523 RepID=A0ABS8JJT1_9GAMM|nr:MFS transporter [Lysobacter lactosilyticus]MCC8363703.1 MFS transporter [Lysobacter lactosilyticus]